MADFIACSPVKSLADEAELVAVDRDGSNTLELSYSDCGTIPVLESDSSGNDSEDVDMDDELEEQVEIMIAYMTNTLPAHSQPGNPCSAAVHEILLRLHKCKKVMKEGDLSEEKRHIVRETVRDAEECCRKKSEECGLGRIPRRLFLRSCCPGMLPPSRVGGSPSFQVRGKNYLQDCKKVPSAGVLFIQRAVQLVQPSQFIYHVAQEAWCCLPVESNEEWLVLNLLFPGATCVQVVAVYSATPAALKAIKAFRHENISDDTSDQSNQSSPSIKEDKSDDISSNSVDEEHAWTKLLQQFWKADQHYCDSRFKLIPAVIEGSWAIKMAVGQKPALSGKKLQQKYFCGKNYFEMDVDVSSSAIATGILRMVSPVFERI